MNRRSFIATSAGALLASRLNATSVMTRPRPSPSQLRWQRDELAIFVHFGINTFTNREWGDGAEDPAAFAPAQLDARQWARVARASGFRAMILTAKHHDGFCLWPTATTTHSVASSPWRSGDGDLVREFVDACRAEGLRPGLYLSPWDRNHPTYGDSPRYNAVYEAQLTELLTRYGPLHEVWFDGANGEGPNGKRQAYDWPQTFETVRRLQSDAVMFSDAGPDVRWCGNESGSAGEPNWSTVDPAVVPYPGTSGPGIIDALQHGDPDGTVWRPAEADVSIRPGWFYHPAEDDRVRTADNLLDIYTHSVGRNSKLLLNVPPTPDGLFHETDIARLAGFQHRRSALFDEDLAAGALTTARAEPGSIELDLGRDVTIGMARLTEDITTGQRIARYTVSAQASDSRWTVLSRGTTIGYTKIDQFPPVTARRVRLTIDAALDPPPEVRLSLHAG